MSGRRPAVLLMGDTLNLGGTEGQFVAVARGLDRSRWNVDVACLRAEGPLRLRLEEVGLQPWSCGRGSFRSPGFLLAVAALARRLRARQTQIVHSFDFYSNVLGITAARLARVPVAIASQRDLGDLRPRHQRRIHSLMLKLASHIMVNSEAIAERLDGTRAARSGRLVVVRNGVDLTRFRPRDTATPRSGPLTIGTLANLRPEKGLREFVEAAGLLRQRASGLRFSIWGDGALRQELEARVRALGLADSCRLHGATAEPETALRQCDIFVLSSLSEGSSNVILEAMATGLPVIATRVGGTPALLEDRRSGLLVPPGDPAALARAIVQLAETPSLVAPMGENARTRAVAEFGMDRMLSQVDELYRKGAALAGHPLPDKAIQGV